ncbi:MAG: tetratricopeptide repeat protein [Candidatus Odinarchaeota archaeon]
MFSTRFKKLKQAEQLLRQEKPKDALQELDVFDSREELEKDERIAGKILKSNALIKIGNAENCFEIIEEALRESRKLDDQFLLLEASIARIYALLFSFQLSGKDTPDQLSEHLRLIEQTEQLLIETTSLQERERMERGAFLKRCKGFVCKTQRKQDQALQYLQESVNLYEKLEHRELTIDTRDNIVTITNGLIGQLFEEIGDNYRGMEYFKKKTELYEKTGNKHALAGSRMWLSNFYFNLGELDPARGHAQDNLSLCEEIQHEMGIIFSFSYLGHVCLRKGEPDQALDYYQKALVTCEKNEFKGMMAHALHYAGMAYISKGDLKTALDYNKKALILAREVSATAFMGWVLHSLVVLSVDTDSLDSARDYFHQLQDVNEKVDHRLTDQLYRLAWATLLKTSTRLKDKVKAQELFRQVAEEEVYFPDWTYNAMVNYAALLLFELRSTGDKQVLKEVKELTEKLLETAKEQGSQPVLVETYLLQSKLALLELDVKKAQLLLDQAQLIAEEKNLGRLARVVTLEQDLLSSQLNKWEKIIRLNPSMSELHVLTQLDDLIERMIYKRVHRDEEALYQYAAKAKQLLENSMNDHYLSP